MYTQVLFPLYKLKGEIQSWPNFIEHFTCLISDGILYSKIDQ